MADEALAEIEVRGEIQAEIQQCPNGSCTSLMQRVQGCHSMKCPTCGFWICALCGHPVTAQNHGEESHSCVPQQAIDAARARRIAQQQLHAPRGGVYLMVLTPSGESVTIPFDETETGATLQAKIAQRTNIAIESQNLAYGGQPITAATVLSTLHLRKGATLTLSARVVGG
jgi:hypothetical protein